MKTLFDLVVVLNTIVQKSTITKVFSLIITKYSYYQLMDQDFHNIVLESEKMLHYGQYLEGLQLLVHYIFTHYINNIKRRQH